MCAQHNVCKCQLKLSKSEQQDLKAAGCLFLVQSVALPTKICSSKIIQYITLRKIRSKSAARRNVGNTSFLCAILSSSIILLYNFKYSFNIFLTSKLILLYFDFFV